VWLWTSIIVISPSHEKKKKVESFLDGVATYSY